MEKILLQTDDKIHLTGNYYAGSEERGVLLLHMMLATKESWHAFAEALEARGFHTVAIDLRGHGESDGGPEGYKSMSDGEHRQSSHDVEAALDFLAGKGLDEEQVVLIGASIGANLALQTVMQHPSIKDVACLSAGLVYHGIETKTPIRQLNPDQRVFFATSEDDRAGENTAENRELFELVPEGVEKKLIVYKNAGHGTDMFGKEEPDLAKALLAWLK